jgi:hypothetical protein
LDTTKIKIDADQDHILFTVGLYKLFLALGKEGMDALSVYIHLFFTARIQSTNTVWANNSYLQKGTACGEAKIKKAKTLLKSLGLIEYKRDKPQKGTPFLGKVYIKLNIIPNKETMEKILSSTGSMSTLVDDNTSCDKVSKCLNIKSKVLVNTNSPSESKDSSDTINDLKQDIPKTNNDPKRNRVLHISKDFQEIINIWNSIKLISKHSQERYSKTLEQASKYIMLLQTGKFIERLDITDDKLTKLNVPLKDKSKKFSQEDIIKGLHNYSLQFEEGYWPCTEADKLKLPRSLESCFYNKYNQNCVSPFLKVFYNKPKKMQSVESLPEIKDPGYNILREILKSMAGSSLDEVKLYSHTKLIREWIAEIREDFKYLPTRSNDAFYSRFTTDQKSVNLFRDLEDFLQQRKEGNVIAHVNMVKPGTKTWKDFEIYLFKNFEIDVNNPPKKPKEIIKKVPVIELLYPWDREEDDFHLEACMYRNFTEDQKKYFKNAVLAEKCKNQEELEKVIEKISWPMLHTLDEIESMNKKAKALGRSDLVRRCM